MNNTTVQKGLPATLALMALVMAVSEVSAQTQKPIQKPVTTKSAEIRSLPSTGPVIVGSMVQVQAGSGPGDCEDGVWSEADSTCNPNNDSPGAGGGGSTLPPVVVTSPPKPPTMPPPPPPTTQPSEGTPPASGGAVPPKPAKSPEKIAEEKKLCESERDRAQKMNEKTYDAEIQRCNATPPEPLGPLVDVWDRILKPIGQDCLSRARRSMQSEEWRIGVSFSACMATAEQN